jgi:hypothetical protein
MAAKKRERREKTWSRDISVWSFGIWVVKLKSSDVHAYNVFVRSVETVEVHL